MNLPVDDGDAYVAHTQRTVCVATRPLRSSVDAHGPKGRTERQNAPQSITDVQRAVVDYMVLHGPGDPSQRRTATDRASLCDDGALWMRSSAPCASPCQMSSMPLLAHLVVSQ